MADIDYRALRSMLAIRGLLDLIAYKPTSVRGDQWRGPCPIADHGSVGDRDGCFSVHLSRNVFRCFRCQAGGNQLDLWVAITRQPLYSAALDLCHRLGVDPPRLPGIRNSETGPA